MELKAIINDGAGNKEITLDMSIYKSALPPKDELDRRYPVNAGQPLASDQLLAQCGLFRKTDPRKGIVTPRIKSLMDDGYNAATVPTAPGGVGISRFLAPMAILSAVEDALYEDRSSYFGMFMDLVGQRESIQGLRAERPVFNFNAARNSRSRPIAQGSEPVTQGLLNVGEKSYTIPVYSHGLEITDQAAEYFGTDMINRCVRLMISEDMADRVDQWLISMLNGDADYDMAALTPEKAQLYDSTISTNGILTQKAYMHWINAKSRVSPITHLITNFDTAYKIENRTGRPTIMGDNATSRRIDTTEYIMNPSWPGELPVVIVNHPNWPANTILGISKPDAILYFNSTSAAYNAVESFVIRRTSKIRIDYGGLAIRHFDQAFHPLSLTV